MVFLHKTFQTFLHNAVLNKTKIQNTSYLVKKSSNSYLIDLLKM